MPWPCERPYMHVASSLGHYHPKEAAVSMRQSIEMADAQSLEKESKRALGDCRILRDGVLVTGPYVRISWSSVRQ